MLDNYKDVITIKDLMEILSIGKNSAYNILHNGTIKYFTLGRNIKIPKKSVIEYINTQIAQE